MFFAHVYCFTGVFLGTPVSAQPTQFDTEIGRLFLVFFQRNLSPILYFQVCLFVLTSKMSKSVKKQVEEAREHNSPDLDLSDRGISKLIDIPGLCKCTTRFVERN